jgi:hypothetical protein
MRRSIPLVLLAVALCSLAQAAPSPFIVPPYLQLGDAPRAHDPERMELLWESDQAPHRFTVQVDRRPPAVASRTAVSRPGFPPYAAWRADLAGLAPGRVFHYRVLEDGEEVFAAEARARPAPGMPTRFAVFGDCGEGTPAERAIARLAAGLHPDFVFIPGDVVYYNGREDEYRARFFPYYNGADAPLMRSILFLSAVGNHDAGSGRKKYSGDLATFPDGLAWFLDWSEPRNGPDSPFPPPLHGPKDREKVFRAAAGPRFPRTANYSFDYGVTHWTVLDSNPNVDWTHPRLRDWLRKDLGATRATWRIVAFHHPGFHSSVKHFDEQQMRLIGCSPAMSTTMSARTPCGSSPRPGSRTAR